MHTLRTVRHVEAIPDAEAWVLELGMNHAGEVRLLQEICRPTVRVITNIGEEHLEGLGSIENVADAECEILATVVPRYDVPADPSAAYRVE